MRRIFYYLLVIVSLFSFSLIDVSAKEEIKIYFFHGDGCPHCAEEEVFLKKIEKKYPEVSVERYEVWKDKDNALLMEKVGRVMDIDIKGVPLTIIGSSAFSGYSESSGMKLERAISYYKDHTYVDVVSKIRNGTYTVGSKKIKDKFSEEDAKTDEASTIKIPLIGYVNMKDVSLPTASMVIGFIDGFNPCAMWVLLFLIGMLLGMKDRKRMWSLGIIFLVVSAIMYLLIMLSWFNLVVSAFTSIWFRNLIAVVAIIGAIINLRGFKNSNDSGCNVVDSKKRKKIFTKIKKFTSEKSFILAILGVCGLAVSVNIVELACSAGFPLIFTQILAINNVSNVSAFFYTLLYVIFFLIDDIVVFAIAMVTTKVSAASTKYNKYSHLVSGILMLIVGILLIFKPEWLMFNFS